MFITQQPSSTARQRGAATLIFALVMLTGITALTLTVTRTSVHEQRIAGNEYRDKEALEAAESGLEYGIGWLHEHDLGALPFALGEVYDANHASWDADAQPQQAVSSGTGSYTVSLTYRLVKTNPEIVLVSADAAGAQDTHIQGQSRQFVSRGKPTAGPGAGGPPLVVNGCVDHVTGNPDIYPVSDSGSSYYGDAIWSNNHALYTSADPEYDANCVDSGHFDLHGGAVDEGGFATPSVWELFFDVPKWVIKSYSEHQESLVAQGVMSNCAGQGLPVRTYFWMTSSDFTGNTYDAHCGSGNHKHLGAADRPAILIFDASADCPRLNGNDTIYGIVYYDGGCEDTSGAGWGSGTVYGSVLMEGDLGKFTSNGELHGTEYSIESGAPGNLFIATRIPGTWMDY